MEKGKIIILSGSSGSGKTTISNFLLSKIPNLKFSISCTTRSIRYNEKHGKDYYFISVKSFISKIKKKKFLEWEEVYPKIFYGTLKSEFLKILKSKKNILFDVDVKGALNLKKKYPNNSLTIFIMVNSQKILKKRLLLRNHKQSKNQIKIRLDKVKKENNYAKLFDSILDNKNLFQTKKKIMKLVSNFIKKINHNCI